MNDPRLWIFHGLYLALGGAFLLWAEGIPVGWRLFIAGCLYNLALPFLALRCVQPRWLRMWTFLLPLSLLQIFPDWFLVDILGTLEFPDLGFPKIGPVSAFMGLLWITPLFLIVILGEWVLERSGRWPAVAAAGLFSMVIFGIAEATLTHIPVWHPVGVKGLGPMAYYVLIPEAILGASTWWAFRVTEDRSIPARLAAAVLVMLLYIASLSASYALIEGF